MSVKFFEQPILNSPYEIPSMHWDLDERGRPTDRTRNERRPASFITPIPQVGKGRDQRALVFDTKARGLEEHHQQYNVLTEINDLRREVAQWRNLPSAQWRVTPETARLLKHWRHHSFSSFRPFFCQVEAAETVIWLTEVAPRRGKAGQRFLQHLEEANDAANPGLPRLALKLATGAGKTTVMAMLIAWQTVNATRYPASKRFTKGFLITTPGLTIRDRLRVLRPNDPDSYYRSRELVPNDMIQVLEQARIVITNFHAFMRRDTREISKAARSLLQGRGPVLQTLETEGQMIQRVMPELMGLRGILALNDEAHHCYRRKLHTSDEGPLKGDARNEATKNTEKARIWLSGLEAVQRKLGIGRVLDLSATPFFLRGSGYAEGTLFPWTMSDFSLMDAIEAGIVKLPRVPVADNIPDADVPKFRYLWDHIGPKMRKKKANPQTIDPLSIPAELETALEALYMHYERTYECWMESGAEVPPCFIVVCNNTSTSELVYRYISGWKRPNVDGSSTLENGRLSLFRNFNEMGEPFGRPRTVLIDSEKLESDEPLDTSFRKAAADEIERFRRETVERTGDHRQADNLTDKDLLREVMNTVGRPGRLGGATRCVVSVAMLTEGWDANTVTHILGLRAFGTQLLCEQVVGRSLRRYSHRLNESGRFNPEYADILGIPFDFAAQQVPPPPPPPPETILVQAVSPDRDACEITFPRVVGYRVELPEDQITANFSADSTLVLNKDLVGPSITRNEGVIGQGVDLDLGHMEGTRSSAIAYHLTRRLLQRWWRDPNDAPKYHLFGKVKAIAQAWVNNHLICEEGTYPAQVLYHEMADIACERIGKAVQPSSPRRSEDAVRALLDPFDKIGSTMGVRFHSTRQLLTRTDQVGPSLWKTRPDRCHVNYAPCDSSWEVEFCRLVEGDRAVRAYVKNQGLGFEVPYRFGAEARAYIPDFIVLLYDGCGSEDLLRVVVEIKGYRREDAKDKAATMRTRWIPSVNAMGEYGRWRFMELGAGIRMDDGVDVRKSLRDQYVRAFNDLLTR